MIGSTIRAAPSTISRGGWKRCSAVFRGGDLRRILVGDPPRVHRVHVDAVLLVVGGGGAGHHVERGLGHVGVRVAGRLEVAVELALHRGHVDDVLGPAGRAQHERLEPGIEDERRHRVHQVHLEQLDRGHVGHQHPPRVPLAQVQLLAVLVEPSLGERAASRRHARPAAAPPATAPPRWRCRRGWAGGGRTRPGRRARGSRARDARRASARSGRAGRGRARAASPAASRSAAIMWA